MKPQELVCEICGRDYPVWSADNDLWNAVMRLPDGSDQHDFVCPTCFTIRAAFAGVETSFWVTGISDLRAERDKLRAAVDASPDVRCSLCHHPCRAYRSTVGPGGRAVYICRVCDNGMEAMSLTGAGP